MMVIESTAYPGNIIPTLCRGSVIEQVTEVSLYRLEEIRERTRHATRKS